LNNIAASGRLFYYDPTGGIMNAIGYHALGLAAVAQVASRSIIKLKARSDLTSVTLAELGGLDVVTLEIRTSKFYTAPAACPAIEQRWRWSTTNNGMANSVAAHASIGGYWVQVWDRAVSLYDFGAYGDFSPTAFTGTDDTIAAQNWLAALSNLTVFPAGAEGEIPPAIFTINGELATSTAMPTNYGRIAIRGAGPGTSILVQTHATSPLLVIEKGANGSYGGPKLSNFSLYSMQGTGNLLENYKFDSEFDSIYFSGTKGRAVLHGGERSLYNNCQVNWCKQAFVCLNARNESYPEGFNVINPGVSANPFNESNKYYHSINAVNGVFPASGALKQDHRAVVVFRNVQNMTWHKSSIKNMSKGLPAFKVSGSCENVRISHLYCEGFSVPSFQPSVIYGGRPETSPTTGVLLVGGLTVDVASSEWFDAVHSSISRMGNETENYVILPPDYVAGSATASSIGGGIVQGDYEIVTSTGFVGNQFRITARAANGTTAKEWPVGALVMDTPWLATGTGSGGKLMSSVGILNIDDCHLEGQVSGLGSYTMTPNYDIGETGGQVILGVARQNPHWMDVQNSANYRIILNGNTVFRSPGNRIEVLGNGTLYAPFKDFATSAVDPTAITVGDAVVYPITYTDTTHGTAFVYANGYYISNYSSNTPSGYRDQISTSTDGNNSGDSVRRGQKDVVFEDATRGVGLPNHKLRLRGADRTLRHEVWDGAGETAADYTVRARLGQINSRECLELDGHIITFGATVPASGTWTQGDVCWNASAAVGQPNGWRCTVSGSPGTWVAMANL